MIIAARPVRGCDGDAGPAPAGRPAGRGERRAGPGTCGFNMSWGGDAVVGRRRAGVCIAIDPVCPSAHPIPTFHQFMKGLFRALVQGTRASNAIPAGTEKGRASTGAFWHSLDRWGRFVTEAGGYSILKLTIYVYLLTRNPNENQNLIIKKNRRPGLWLPRGREHLLRGQGQRRGRRRAGADRGADTSLSFQ